MARPLNRRSMLTGCAGAALLPQAPSVLARQAAAPVAIASANGHRFKNGGTQTCVEKAFALLTSGADVLDALIAGVNIVELDPADTSVGYGGLPNADGVVQLDASVMHGAKRRAGAVACLEGVRTPSLVAKAVMEQTDHHLLVGSDARRFARQLGFKIEADLNSESSRRLWLEWKRRIDPQHYLDPAKRAAAGHRAALAMAREGLLDPEHLWGTIHCSGLSPKGEIAGLTSTSGLAWKIPGRVGDSPVLGAGLYVDGEVGAAGSTGRGEANLFNLGAFVVVEEMRRGAHPKDAGMEALRRIRRNTLEKRLLNSRGTPSFNVVFYALDRRGRHAGVSLYTGVRYSACGEDGPRLLDCEGLLEGRPEG